MTVREAYITIWKRLGLSELQIADALVQHEIVNPGTLDKAAPFKPGREQAGIDRLVLECAAIAVASREQKVSLKQVLEAHDIERAIRN